MLKSIKKLLIPLILIVLGVIYFISDTDISNTIYWYSIKFPCVLLVIIIGIILINKIDKLDKSKNCDYYKDVDNIISPEIAEFIINNKIDNKNILMTLLLNLKIHKNIDFVNNNKIILLNKDNISDYELDLIDTLFKDSNEFDLNELNSYFKNSNKDTKRFYQCLENIKRKISHKAYSMNIYDLKSNNQVDLIRIILLLICGFIILYIIWSTYLDSFVTFFYIFVTYAFFKYYHKKNNYKTESKLSQVKKTFIRIIVAIFMIVPLISGGIEFLDLIIYLIDFIIIFSLCNKDVFTEHGKYEQNKVLGLKKYIEDYSLLEEKDVLDATLWEKYLVYATAFGIPDKVINKTNENNMKFNIFLQLLNNCLHTN